jgi:hypothetical protein
MKEELLIPIILAAIIILAVIAILAIVRAVKQQKQKTQKELADHPDAVPRGTEGESTHAGITYRYKHFRGTDKAPPYFRITIPCSSQGAFKITRETKFDRFFKRLGICVELDTHDPEFDDRFYITTDTIPFTRACLERRENRESIRTVFDLGFNHLKHDGKAIILTWNRFPRRQLMETAVMEQGVALLAVLHEKLPGIPGMDTQESSAWKSKRLLSFALPGLALVTGIIALIVGLTTYRPLDTFKIFLNSLSISLPLFVLFVWFSIHLLKGRSSSHRELIAVFFIALFGFPLAGFGYTAYLNGAWDREMEMVHDVQVVKKFYSRSKSSYTYYARVNSWRQDRETEKLRVSRRFYNRLQAGESIIAVTTKPGKFGYEWIVRIE